MSEQRETYLVQGGNIEEVKSSLFYLLGRIADRLDQLEGLKGTPTFYSSTFSFPLFPGAVASLFKLQDDQQTASFEPLDASDVPDHNHTSSSQGGDYPWADLTAIQVAALQSLVTQLAALSASKLVETNASKELISSDSQRVFIQDAAPSNPRNSDIWIDLA